MDADPQELEVLAVEPEAGVGLEDCLANSESDGLGIDRLVAGDNVDCGLVEVRDRPRPTARIRDGG